ncbi:hypothetical protein ABDK00_005680 [Niabella insulamsoli]|uniref:hypothetical protein n=1 Tax=Niabella insulamsoli TaxID=3144874 RepID=UPI0031FC73CC
MKLKLVHIIACFLLSLFASKEVSAEMRLFSAEQKEICTDCESRSAENSTEERSGEQEQKLLAEPIQLPILIAGFSMAGSAYYPGAIPTIHLGIVTPPPEQA